MSISSPGRAPACSIYSYDIFHRFRAFGPLRYVRITADPATGRSRGTGFACFWNKEDADKVVDQSEILRSETTGQNSAVCHPYSVRHHGLLTCIHLANEKSVQPTLDSHSGSLIKPSTELGPPWSNARRCACGYPRCREQTEGGGRKATGEAG